MKHETNYWFEESQNGHIILNYGIFGMTVHTLCKGQSFGTKIQPCTFIVLFVALSDASAVF